MKKSFMGMDFVIDNKIMLLEAIFMKSRIFIFFILLIFPACSITHIERGDDGFVKIKNYSLWVDRKDVHIDVDKGGYAPYKARLDIGDSEQSRSLETIDKGVEAYIDGMNPLSDAGPEVLDVPRGTPGDIMVWHGGGFTETYKNTQPEPKEFLLTPDLNHFEIE